MNKSSIEEEENFAPDELVDIINPKTQQSYEGKIISIKGEKIIVENLKTRQEKAYNKDEKRVIKQWSPGKPLKKFNRVDFQLKGTEYWVEGIVIDIKPNKEILIKYKNHNNFKRYCEEKVGIDDTRLAKPGYYTKYDKNEKDKLLSSTNFNLDSSNFNNPGLNRSELNLLNKKRERSDEIGISEYLDNGIKSDDLLNSKAEIDEEEIFKTLLYENHLQIREVKGDGNCMFRAISDQVYGADEYYNLIRQKCMNYLVALKNFFKPFIGEDFDTYIYRKRQDGVWGDDIELEVFSEIYGRPIEIYMGSGKPLKTFHENQYYYDTTQNKDSKYLSTPIRLSYHKQNHYNSIIPLESDVDNYRRYKDSIIKSEPGVFESKMIRTAIDNEKVLEKGIKESKEFNLRLKNNLSETILDISKKYSLNLEKEYTNKLKVKTEENQEKKEESKINTDKDKEKEKVLNNESLEKSNIQVNNEDDLTSNPIIKSVLELGFGLDETVDAWLIYKDKDLIVDYLLGKQKEN